MRNKTIQVRTIAQEDFSHYKEPAMVIGMPYCDWKCEKECGQAVCHNAPLSKLPIQELCIDDLVTMYLNNPITSAVVFAGLEPLGSFDEIIDFLDTLRRKRHCKDPVIIYTGYRRDEIHYALRVLAKYENVIVKLGRYVPGRESHMDPILGVPLANPEQYAVRLEQFDPLDTPPFKGVTK